MKKPFAPQTQQDSSHSIVTSAFIQKPISTPVLRIRLSERTFTHQLVLLSGAKRSKEDSELPNRNSGGKKESITK
jgi:hypothetical protein